MGVALVGIPLGPFAMSKSSHTTGTAQIGIIPMPSG